MVHKYTVMACAMVERTFPPSTTNEVERIAASLNLLNAIVKLEAGKLLTSYNYIKGMAGCLFVWLLHHPIEGIELYLDEEEDVTFVCIKGMQYSFHHVPVVRYYVKLRNGEGLTKLKWDGVQRQAIAAELFHRAIGALPKVSNEEGENLIYMMRHCSTKKIIRKINELDGVPPIIKEETPQSDTNAPLKHHPSRVRRIGGLRKFVERHLPSPNHPEKDYGEWKQQAEKWRNTKNEYLYKLTLSLKFNGWWEQKFVLTRKGDTHVYRVVSYTGDNYSDLVRSIMGKRPLAYIRPERLMRRGWHYFLKRSSWSWVHMTYTRYLLLTGHYNNLRIGGKDYNLCITYRMARYLSVAYPELRFINVLNFTRFKVRRKVYSAKDLQKVGLYSKSRELKVWMVVDPLLY